MRICNNCRTRYVKGKRQVRVLTSYEHEFQRIYKEFADSDPTKDLQKYETEQADSTHNIIERAEYRRRREQSESARVTIVLYPGDRMFVKDGMLSIFKRTRVETIPILSQVR